MTKARTILGIFTIIFVFLSPYFVGAWWKYYPATVLILLFAYMIFSDQWLSIVGLKMTRKQVVLSLILLCLVILASKSILVQVTQSVGIQRFQAPLRWRPAPFFQSFNEEIVLRALLLFALTSRVKNQFLVAFGAAAVFSGLHWIFYHYNLIQSVDLGSLTILNLFLFGLVCNRLFLTYNHIGFGLALHAGWNLVRFTSEYTTEGKIIPEGETFNLFEGSFLVTMLILGAYLSIRCLASIENRHRSLAVSRKVA